MINFGERSEEECRREWPELMAIVERKVKPERIKKDGKKYPRMVYEWWKFWNARPALEEAITGCERVLAVSRVTEKIGFAAMSPGSVFSERLVVLPQDEFLPLALLQTRLHEIYSLFFGSSLEDRFMYAPSDCFETFPFPTAFLESAANDSAHGAIRQSLDLISETYNQLRMKLMVSNNEGLTSTYNRFHDPSETSGGLLDLRRLHEEMDQAVLAAYGWSDVDTACGFGLDYLDTEDEPQLLMLFRSASMPVSCSSGMPTTPSISKASSRPTAPSPAVANFPGATAGLMRFAMMYSHDYLLSTLSATPKKSPKACTAKARRRLRHLQGRNVAGQQKQKSLIPQSRWG